MLKVFVFYMVICHSCREIPVMAKPLCQVPSRCVPAKTSKPVQTREPSAHEAQKSDCCVQYAVVVATLILPKAEEVLL